MVASKMFRKNWLLLAGMTVAVVGCGGGGGNGGGGVIIPPENRSRPSVALGEKGVVQTVFLSGSGRAAGSQVAEINVIRFSDGTPNFIPSADNALNQGIRIALDGFTINQRTFGVDFAGNSGKTFTQFPMEIARMFVEQGDGSVSPLTPEGTNAFVPPVPFDTKLRVLPGRVSTLTVRLNDQILAFSNATSSVIFNSDLFISQNYDQNQNAMASQFSDYLSFDISRMPANLRPPLSISGTPAERVFYSGDGIAMSVGMGQSSEFELLDPVNIRGGKVSLGPVIGPNGNAIQGSNVFILDDAGPNATSVTSIIGTWKNFEKAVQVTDSVTALAFPSSRETDSTSDMEEQQFLVFASDGTGNVSNMWQGQVFYNTAGDPTRGTFRLFPIATITDAIPTEEVSGIVSNLTFRNGVVTGGDWDITSATPSSWNFPLLGGFSVYRR